MSGRVQSQREHRPSAAAGRSVLTEVTASRWRAVLVLGTSYAGLTVLVALGVTHGIDVWVRDALRPNGEWGRAQVLFNPIIDGLATTRVLLVCLFVAVAACALRRSVLPLVATGAVVGGTLLVGLGTKGLLTRPDPSGGVGGIGGSYPSGHVLTLVVTTVLCLLLIRAHPPALASVLVPLPAVAMGWALLVCSAHWLTDVLGALLLGTLATFVARTPSVTRALQAGRHHLKEEP